jgi:hypothetical protein
VVVPLGGIAFHGRNTDEPGEDGWAVARFSEETVKFALKGAPAFLRDYRRHRWTIAPDGRLVAPPLAGIAWRLARS